MLDYNLNFSFFFPRSIKNTISIIGTRKNFQLVDINTLIQWEWLNIEKPSKPSKAESPLLGYLSPIFSFLKLRREFEYKNQYILLISKLYSCSKYEIIPIRLTTLDVSFLLES